MKLHHIAVQVFDLERSATFYQQLFGFPEIRRQPHSIWLDADGTILMLEKCSRENVPSDWKSDVPGLFVMAFSLTPEERKTFRQTLTKHQIPISHETQFTTYIRDPDGNRLAVSHYPIPPIT